MFVKHFHEIVLIVTIETKMFENCVIKKSITY